jgi:hypothetical protein
MRKPADGFYPPMVNSKDIQSVGDLQKVPTYMLHEVMRSIIANNEGTIDAYLSRAILRHLYDRDGPLVEMLYDRLCIDIKRIYCGRKGSPSSSSSGSSKWMTIASGESYNLMMQSAAMFSRNQLLA